MALKDLYEIDTPWPYRTCMKHTPWPCRTCMKHTSWPCKTCMKHTPWPCRTCMKQTHHGLVGPVWNTHHGLVGPVWNTHHGLVRPVWNTQHGLVVGAVWNTWTAIDIQQITLKHLNFHRTKYTFLWMIIRYKQGLDRMHHWYALGHVP